MNDSASKASAIAPAVPVLVAGVGPLPPEGGTAIFAPGLRTWGMARELARAGHPVHILAPRFGSVESSASVFQLQPGSEPDLKSIDIPATGSASLIEMILTHAQATGAQAVVATTDVMNHAVAASGLALPFWADYFGDPMAEKQMLAAANRHDGDLAAQWSLVAPVLARADVVSGCSPEQAAALLGELGTLGRLNQHTFDYGLVRVLKPWLTPLPAAGLAGPRFRGHDGSEGWPAKTRVVIQSGGFNTWLDHERLFAVLDRAMEIDPALHFACIGGAIAGHYTAGFEAFSAQVAASQHRARYHLLGWVPLEAVPAFFAEADLAINIDHACPEGRLGTRNRLLDWALAGLPILTTPHSPLAVELSSLGLAELLPSGAPVEALARQLASAVAQGADRREALKALRGLLNSTYSPAVCLGPLIDWAAAPGRAPDLQIWEAGRAQPPALWSAATGLAEAVGELETLRIRHDRLRQKLARVTGSRLIRMMLKLKGESDLTERED